MRPQQLQFSLTPLCEPDNKGESSVDGLSGNQFASMTSLMSKTDLVVPSRTSPPKKQKAIRRFPRRKGQVPLNPNTPSKNQSLEKVKHTYKVVNNEEVEQQQLGPEPYYLEVSKGRRRLYKPKPASEDGQSSSGFTVIDEKESHQNWANRVVSSYMLPQGYPHSVAPQYATYMQWRGVQYFFGGAIAVFTTKSLLGALGVGSKRAAEASAAINWVLKDGAGRFGRFLFARWGRELDSELKQFRFFGDLLMFGGATLELSTCLLPRAFLPLACSANLAKNLAAVSNSSTRAPIYRSFTKQNNLADISAKGESVANLADLAGMTAGIIVTKAKLPAIPTFLTLAVGYIISSRREIDSVVLKDINRARLAYTARKFMETSVVPEVYEGNKEEALYPWGLYNSRRVLLGARVEDIAGCPAELKELLHLFKGDKYAVAYRSNKVSILLQDDCSQHDTFKSAFTAHALLHVMDRWDKKSNFPPTKILNKVFKNTTSRAEQRYRAEYPAQPQQLTRSGREALKQLQAVRKQYQEGAQGLGDGCSRASIARQQEIMKQLKPIVAVLFEEYKVQAGAAGWRLDRTALNPREHRLVLVSDSDKHVVPRKRSWVHWWGGRGLAAA